MGEEAYKQIEPTPAVGATYEPQTRILSLICRHSKSEFLVISESPAWKVFPELMPRPTHKDYIFALETMSRKEARRLWREGIKACWNHQCAFCNAIPIADESLTLDHVKPKSAGGEDLTSNLIPACSSCNSDKGSTEWKTWFRAQPFYSEMREKEIESWMQQGRRGDAPEYWETAINEMDISVTLEERVLAKR